jgi:hypothetical protein
MSLLGLVMITCCGGWQSLAATASGKVDLTGIVSNHDGTPIPNATVYIYSAAPKHGDSVLCPFCYLDCGKRAQTDARGRFKIQALDDSLVFRLLVMAKDHESKLVPKIDPTAGEVEVALNNRDLSEVDPKLRIAGLVVGEDGKPVPAAVISPEGVQTGSSTRWGGTSRSVDPMAVTDEAGRFVLVCREEVDAVHATVEGRGFAQRWIQLKPGKDYLVRVQDGVTVNGRILNDGRPVPNVRVGMVTSDRAAGNLLRCDEIATDQDGRFLIANVTPEREFVLYTTMASLRGLGAVLEKKFTTGQSRTKQDLGDLAVQSGFRVSGRVILSDGESIPLGTKLLLGREGAWDHAEALLGDNGGFEFRGVPRGPVNLNVRIRGYKCSKKNPNLDWLNGGIVGTVDGNITDLTILLEPGQ